VQVWLGNRVDVDVYVAVRSLFGQTLVLAPGNPRGDDDDGYRAYVDDDGGGFAMVGPFDATNWNIPQNFSVSAVDDDAAEWSRGGTGLSTWYKDMNGDDVLAVFGISAKDERYNGLIAERNVTAFVEDNDVVGLKLQYPYSATAATHTYATLATTMALTATEGSLEASSGFGKSYGVSLTSQPFGDVVVTVVVAHSDHDWINASPASAFVVTCSGAHVASPAVHALTFTSANWNVPKRVSVLIKKDFIARPDPSFLVTLKHEVSSAKDAAYDAKTFATEPAVAMTVKDDDVAGLFRSATKLTVGCDFDGNVMFGEEYSIALTSQPTAPVALSLATASAHDLDVPAPELHLAKRDFYFTASDWAERQYVVVNATSTDLKKRSEAILHGVFSDDAVYGSQSTGIAAVNAGKGPLLGVTVEVSRDSTPPPKLHSTEFGPTGATAKIVFDRFTNQAGLAGKWPCDRLLFGEAVEAFGSTHFCSWTSSTVLRVTFSKDATVKPGAFFGIKNSVLQSSAPNTTLYTQNATGYLTTPVEAVKPVVTLNAPSVIGDCDSLLVDARLTTGSGGRAFKIIWNVTYHNLPENVSVANLTFAVNEASRTNALWFKVPPADVPKVSMTFSLRTMNWLGNDNSGSVAVTKVNTDPPIVQIAGYGTAARLYLADTFKLTAEATLPACAPGDSPLVFVWSEPSGFLTSQQLLALQTLSPRSIKVKGGVMVAKQTYQFRVTAFVSGYPNVNSTATLSVYAKPSELFASVAGGSARLQSRLNPVELDATGSYDPDLRTSTAHLSYRWDCYDYATKGPCYNNGSLIVIPSLATTEIGAEELKAGRFRLTHTVLCVGDGRNASASVELELAATEVPEVGIEALTVSKVNPNAGSFLRLVGNVNGENLGTVSFEWTKTSGDDPNSASGFASVFAASPMRLATVLELGALTEGSTYAFRLTAFAQGDDDSVPPVSAFAEVSVVVNSPPSTGAFLVSPMEGVALTTEFSLSCEAWVDEAEDLPLR